MTYRIVLIEDDLDQSKPMVDMLKYRGYEVISAYNGVDGIAKVKAHSPDLVIVDLQLVQKGDTLDGFDVIRAIRESEQYTKTAILAWTAHFVDHKDEIRALRSGADDYVRKDINFGALEARIEALTRRMSRRYE